jgi:hypothetical protein
VLYAVRWLRFARPCVLQSMRGVKVYFSGRCRTTLLLGFVFVSLISSTTTWASDSSALTSSAIAQDVKPEEKTSPFGLAAITSLQSSLRNTNDPDYSAETDLILAPSYRLNEEFKLTAKFSFKQELSGYQRALADDGKVGIAMSPFVFNPFMKLTPSTAIRIPLSDASRNQDTMRVGGQVAGSLANDLAAVGLKGLMLTYTLSAGRNLYQYMTSSTGNGNIEYDVNHRVDLAYQVTDRISFAGVGKYLTGLDYSSNWTAHFELDEELDYQLAKAWSLGVGHTNAADALNSDGHSTNVQFYNPYTSAVYGSLSFTY